LPSWTFPLAAVVVFLSHPGVHAQEDSDVRIEPAGIKGSLLICGGGLLPDEIIERFLELAGGEEAHIVVIPTASRKADTESAAPPWKEDAVASVHVLHTRRQEQANEESFVEPLKRATGVWFGGGQQSRIADAYLGTAVERELYEVLERGGVVAGTSAGAAIQSKQMITGGKSKAKLGTGFDLLPGSVIDQHFLRRERKQRLLGVLRQHPGLVGFGVDEGTALEVRGRRLRVLGESTVTVCLSPGKHKPAKEIELKAGDVADLTALRRAAIARAGATFPVEEPRPPIVEKGALILVGGGSMPEGLTERFVELAGGEDAVIVVLPTANPDPLPKRVRDIKWLERAGAGEVVALRGRSLADVESPQSLSVLQRATGIWFGGGRQWRFVDAYADTKTLDLMHDVLRRGGVIGGSSAGASIQAEYLARGDPLGNRDIMAEGYERGFAFLPGTAVDQHFTQRKRQVDMTQLVDAYPQLLGIGLDEGTAILVKGQVAEVIGKNDVCFYDRRKPVVDDKPDYEVVAAGGRYDLVERSIVADSNEPN
jgi:cyanophycinase